MNNEPIAFTFVGHDVNGNARHVCSHFHLLTDYERATLSPIASAHCVSERYATAIKRANKIGGRKYHTRKFGGGLVFQGSTSEIENNIRYIVSQAEAKEVK